MASDVRPKQKEKVKKATLIIKLAAVGLKKYGEQSI
jgi:hypothetical protein